MASSPGREILIKLGSKSAGVLCVLVETSCVSTSRPGRTSGESQNTNGPRLYRAPYTLIHTNPPPPADTGLADCKFHCDLNFDK